MSRHRHTETEFGSDSFLDIVANVVGILIILIVVVGVRVSRMPVVPSKAQTLATHRETVAPAPSALSTAEPLRPEIERTPEPTSDVIWPESPFTVAEEIPPSQPLEPETIIVTRPLPELPSVQPSPELVKRKRELNHSLKQLADEKQRLAQQLQAANQEALNAQQRLQRLKSAADDEDASNRASRSDLMLSERELADTLGRLAVLRRNLETEATRGPDATILRHQMTPIGRVVRGQELHFLLSRGRVSPVPVAELSRRLTTQIERQKAMLAKLQTYNGEIEPIDGFRMKYVVQRSRMSLAEELKYGQQVVRMSVSQWTLVPEPDLPSESLEQALQRGSRFYQALLAAGANATLTFWVYPDSFDLNQSLQEFAHRHGYDVAARPLPFGVMISGSPEGSRSIAQ